MRNTLQNHAKSTENAKESNASMSNAGSKK